MARAQQRVAIIGSGLIGRSWAMVFARAGWQAVLYDRVAGVADSALPLMRDGLEDQARHGLVADAKAAFANISVANSVAACLEGVALVQENGPETVEAKLAIYA